MRNLLLISLLISFSVFSQSKEDYKKATDFLIKTFNEEKPSLIYQKFDENLKKKFSEEIFCKKIDSIFREKGKVSSCESIFEEKDQKSYLTEFEGGSSLVLFFLSTKGEIVKFDITEY